MNLLSAVAALALIGSGASNDRTLQSSIGGSSGTPAMLQAQNETSVLNVTGTGTAKATPDMATVRLGVEIQAPTAQAAQSQVSAATNKFIQAAMKIVADPKNYATSDLSLMPVYTDAPQNSQEPPKVAAYRARNVVTVRVEDFSKVGAVIDASVAAGVTNIESISFGLKNDQPPRLLALRDAVADARAKAEALADALGLRLGPVLEVNESSFTPGPMPMMARAAFADSANTPVMPGQMDLNANVTIKYRLLAKG